MIFFSFKAHTKYKSSWNSFVQ